MPAALMTVEEVGAFLGIDRSTVYRLCSKPNGLRSYKVGSRLWTAAWSSRLSPGTTLVLPGSSTSPVCGL